MRLDQGFVADIERSQTCLSPQRQQLLAGADRGEAQAAELREDSCFVNQRGQSLFPTHGIAGYEHDAAFDAVAKKGASVGAEEIVDVAPQLERGKRVTPVQTQQLRRRTARRVVRQIRRTTERPEQKRRANRNCDDAEQPHRER